MNENLGTRRYISKIDGVLVTYSTYVRETSRKDDSDRKVVKSGSEVCVLDVVEPERFSRVGGRLIVTY